MSANAEDIFALMAADDAARQAAKAHPQESTDTGIETDTPAKDLPPIDWQVSLPTLRGTNHRVSLVATYQCGLDRLKTRFRDIDDVLGQLPFVVAGSAALYSICETADAPNDLDLFYVGPAEDANKHLETLLRRLNNVYLVRLAFDKWVGANRPRPAPRNSTVDQIAVAADAMREFDYTTKAISEALRKPGVLDMDMTDFLRDCKVLDNTPAFSTHASDLSEDDGIITKVSLNPELFDDLLPPESCHFTTAEVAVTRTRNAVTVGAVGVLKVQVVLRVYPNAKTVVFGFDVGASGVAMDLRARRFVVSELAAFALRAKCNIVNIKRLSPTYTARLEKYRKRGFSIIFPHMNLKAVPRDNLDMDLKQVINLRGGVIVASNIVDNTIYGYVTRTGPEREDPTGTETVSDYGVHLVGTIATHYNMSRLTADSKDFVHVAPWHSVLHCPPALSSEAITAYMESLLGKILVRGQLNLRLYSQFVDRHCPIAEFMELSYANRLMRIDQAVGVECRRLLDKWHEIAADPEVCNVRWMTEHPASQNTQYLPTASFNPYYLTEEEWYGKYYAAAP